MTTEELVQQEQMKDEALQMVISNAAARLENLRKLVEGINYSDTAEYKARKSEVLNDIHQLKGKVTSLFTKK